jgi:hypothetical protein
MNAVDWMDDIMVVIVHKSAILPGQNSLHVVLAPEDYGRKALYRQGLVYRSAPSVGN